MAGIGIRALRCEDFSSSPTLSSEQGATTPEGTEIARKPTAHTPAKGEKASEGDTLLDVSKDKARRNKFLDDNSLLKGVVITSNGPQASVYELIKRPSALNVAVDNGATIRGTMSEFEFTEEVTRENYSSASVKASLPFISLSAEYSKESKYRHSVTQQTIYMSQRHCFSQGRVEFNAPGVGLSDNVELSPQFMEYIKAALKKTDSMERREELYKIFNTYGHIFRTRVSIGGVLAVSTFKTLEIDEKFEENKEDIKAGLGVEAEKWAFDAKAEAGHGNKAGTFKTAKGTTCDAQWSVNGGDTTKIKKIDEWIASTNQPVYWRVIETTAVVPVVDMLPSPIKEVVKKLMRPLIGREITDVVEVKLPTPFARPIYQPKDVPDGWFWLGQTAKKDSCLLVKPALPPQHGRNPALSDGNTTTGFADLPQYQYLSTLFGGDGVHNPKIRALRSDMLLVGQYEVVPDTSGSEEEKDKLLIIHPIAATYPEDKCFDLQSVALQPKSKLNPPPKDPSQPDPPPQAPIPRWVLLEQAVLMENDEPKN